MRLYFVARRCRRRGHSCLAGPARPRQRSVQKSRLWRRTRLGIGNVAIVLELDDPLDEPVASLVLNESNPKEIFGRNLKERPAGIQIPRPRANSPALNSLLSTTPPLVPVSRTSNHRSPSPSSPYKLTLSGFATNAP